VKTVIFKFSKVFVFMDYFDNQIIETISADNTSDNKTFPWFSIKGVLTQEGFNALHRDFPPVELFHYHENIVRKTTEQRPHNRFYAAFGSSEYSRFVDETGKGLIQYPDLEKSWQEFIIELRDNRAYHKMVYRLLGTQNFGFHLVWHISIQGNEVSPHVDTKRKLGTHLLYFNTSEDWNPDWGGEFLVLDDLQKLVENPEFEDFKTVTTIPIVNNRSLIFKNTWNAWHGVRPLKCPEGKCRRLANIVIYPKN
jgi:2OG-Fe(II) oxygenase superfamily